MSSPSSASVEHIICPKCSSANTPTNKFCGSCGGKFEKGFLNSTEKKLLAPFAIFFGVIIVGGGLVATYNSIKSKSTERKAPPGPVSSPIMAQPLTPELVPPPGPHWSYSNDQDDMGRTESDATLDSTNTLEFDFPYSGAQHGTLMIRKVHARATYVEVRIEKGQFLCGVEECTVNVRFDDGPIRRFTAVPPSDQSTTVLFIQDASAFIGQLSHAKRVRVEATFYQEGAQALEFHVEGFRPL